jgi:hypothetical protein
MPYKNHFGFIDLTVNGGVGSNGFHKTVAHELAHGIFGLEHTSTFGENLLDYSESTALCKTQWDMIHDPYAGETDMDDPEEAMLQWRNIVWLTDIFYGFAPDEQESEVENHLSMLQSANLSDGWKSETANDDKKTCFIFNNIKNKKDFLVDIEAKNVVTEKYLLNGKNYTVKLFPFSSNVSLSYKNINIDGYASLRENSYIRAAYTKDCSLIVFYKNKHPELILQIKSDEEPKNAVKNFLNYLLIVERNAKQKETDKELSIGWGYLTENTLAQNEVIPFWKSYIPIFEVDLSESVPWISQFDEDIFGQCSGCWDKQCCNRACVYTLGFTNTANCSDSNIAKDNPVYCKERIFVAKFNNDENWRTSYGSKIITATDNLKKAVSYIKEEIKDNHRPVVIGTHFTNRSNQPPGNINKATYHFMVVIGYGADENGEYFRFYDPGRYLEQKDKATSKENKLYLDNGFIKGIYRDQTYTITEINKYF